MKYDWELKKVAKTVIGEMVNLREGENILIYADTAADKQVVDSIAEAAHLAGGVVCLFWYETRPEVGIEPPKPLAAAMKASDVVIELAGRAGLLGPDRGKHQWDYGLRRFPLAP